MFYNDFVIAKKVKKSVKIKLPGESPGIGEKHFGSHKNSMSGTNNSQELKEFKREVRQSLEEIKEECKEIRQQLSALQVASSSKLAGDFRRGSEERNEIRLELKKLEAEVVEAKKGVGNVKDIQRPKEEERKASVGKGRKQSEESLLPKTVQGRKNSIGFSETVIDYPRDIKRSQSQTSSSSSNGLRSGFGMSSPSLNSLEIEPLTKLEEAHQKFLSSKVEEVRSNLQLALDGSSMQGKTIFEISEAMPVERHSFAIQITNLMDVALVDLKSCDHSGITNVPNAIPALEIHALTFGTSKGTSSWGIFTYRIERTEIRLIVYYSAYSKTTLAFAPADVVIDHSLCTYMSKQDISDWSTRPDKRGARVTSKEVCISVSLMNYLARATITGRGRVVMKLEILKTETPPPPALSFRNDDSNSDSSIEEYSPRIDFQGDVGYIIDITNSLHLDLIEPSCHLEDSSSSVPTAIRAMRKKMLPFKIDSMDDMIVAYKIDTTDLRLAVAFGNDTQFSLAILPASIPIDSALLAAMCDSPQWKTRPDLRTGFASEGETLVSVRNLRATAALTTQGKVPTLKLSIASTD